MNKLQESCFFIRLWLVWIVTGTGIRNLKLLLPLIRDYLKGTYRDVSVKSIIIFLITLAYIISPIDLIPDWILGFGQIDDIGILGLSLHFLEKDLMKYREWKGSNGQHKGLADSG